MNLNPSALYLYFSEQINTNQSNFLYITAGLSKFALHLTCEIKCTLQGFENAHNFISRNLISKYYSLCGVRRYFF